jgi:hypothetical protein
VLVGLRELLDERNAKADTRWGQAQTATHKSWCGRGSRTKQDVVEGGPQPIHLSKGEALARRGEVVELIWVEDVPPTLVAFLVKEERGPRHALRRRSEELLEFRGRGRQRRRPLLVLPSAVRPQPERHACTGRRGGGG